MLASAPAAKQRRERRQERRARLERLAAANAAIQSSSHAVVAKRAASRLGTSAEGGDGGFLDARSGDADGNGNDADADSAEHFDAAKQAADREDMEAELRELEAMERADMREEAQIQVRRS
jgi:hypothetical protein